ncbi:hypothetical protein ZIOFF_024611 [Zingiber officinale]|uniref:Uncharacterized protein n=1 Tax=Zingiber officinale TaxID=94328 RepID=A0A8J5LDD5_ZINOF|nr:hypothetical protein ZIOFF_024611 [Zingiber officinale]
MEPGVGDAPASEVLHPESHEQSPRLLPLVSADDSVDVVPSDAYGVVDNTPAFEPTELSYDDAVGGEDARPIGAETAADLGGSAIERTHAFLPVDSMEPVCQESLWLSAEAEAAPAPVKRKRGRPPKAHGAGRKATAPKKKDEEEVCFICFDGGNLVVCDRRWVYLLRSVGVLSKFLKFLLLFDLNFSFSFTRGCPKVYHPSCIHRDESFFRSRSRWNCGWHICSICQKAVTYMCYTCTYSVCKACIGGANFFSVQGQKGFCETCYKTIMLIESNEKTNEEKVCLLSSLAHSFHFRV